MRTVTEEDRKSVVLATPMTREMDERIRRLAREHDVPRSAIVRQALRAWLDSQDEKALRATRAA